MKHVLDRRWIKSSKRQHRRVAALILGVGMSGLAACSTDSADQASSQQISAAVERPYEGPAGPTGSPSADPQGVRGLDAQELQRLRDAVRQAFAATTNATTSYTVVPQNIDAEPTIVSATPAGVTDNRTDGSTCRPIQMSVTKAFRTTMGILTFCRVPGSNELRIGSSS